ncbi:MAG: DUF357 domain-containing protein [Methanomicrobiales archaeon]|nr:DUF357 domain-containing protein [Methanomicrobiales archaeon]
MEIQTFYEELSGVLEHPGNVAPPESLLALAGGEILMMAQCYQKDGSYCLANNDPVNALASFAYAAGWLDTGNFIGIVTSGPLCRNLISGRTSVPAHFHPQLVEKACRYQRLLDGAVTSSIPGSETGIHWYEGGERVIAVAAAYLSGGEMFLRMERFEHALACFSYGHGWLDAALRAGLTRITGNRDLFAI